MLSKVFMILKNNCFVNSKNAPVFKKCPMIQKMSMISKNIFMSSINVNNFKELLKVMKYSKMLVNFTENSTNFLSNLPKFLSNVPR